MTDRSQVAVRRTRAFKPTCAAGIAAFLSLIPAAAAEPAFPSGGAMHNLMQGKDRVGHGSEKPNAPVPSSSPQRKPQSFPVPAVGGTVYPPGRGAPTVGGPMPRTGVIGGTNVKRHF